MEIFSQGQEVPTIKMDICFAEESFNGDKDHGAIIMQCSNHAVRVQAGFHTPRRLWCADGGIGTYDRNAKPRISRKVSEDEEHLSPITCFESWQPGLSLDIDEASVRMASSIQYADNWQSGSTLAEEETSGNSSCEEETSDDSSCCTPVPVCNVPVHEGVQDIVAKFNLNHICNQGTSSPLSTPRFSTPRWKASHFSRQANSTTQGDTGGTKHGSQDKDDDAASTLSTVSQDSSKVPGLRRLASQASVGSFASQEDSSENSDLSMNCYQSVCCSSTSTSASDILAMGYRLVVASTSFVQLTTSATGVVQVARRTEVDVYKQYEV